VVPRRFYRLTKRLRAEIAIVAIPITIMEQILTMPNDSRDVSGRHWSHVVRLKVM
jgi:hypothetical protein